MPPSHSTPLSTAPSPHAPDVASFVPFAEVLPHLAWIADPQGEVRWYNRKWLSYTGAVAEEVQGRGWQSLVDPDALPKVLQQWKAAFASGEPAEMVMRLRGADGVFRPFLTRVQPLKDGQGCVTR